MGLVMVKILHKLKPSMRIVQFFILLYIDIIKADHIDDSNVIMEDFPFKDNNEAYEDSILLENDRSGCLKRQYLITNYVTVYDPVLCKRIPTVRLRVKRVRITSTAITVIHKNDFTNNTNLTMIQLEANTILRSIEPGAFNGLSNLVNLTLTHSKNLKYLKKGAFQGLTNLLYLKFYKNGFAELKDFTYSINAIALPKLKRLDIAQMLFPLVKADEFESLINMRIENLNLVTCKIEYLHPTALSKFRSLKQVGLGQNNLNTKNIVDLLNMTIKFNIPLEYINLYDLGFKELPFDVLKIVAQTNITHIALSKNRFEKINKFPAMPKLVRLDLSEVVALNIEPGAFKLLPNLRKLLLDNNEFSEVPQAVLLPQLQYLDLSNSGRYFALLDKTFRNMTNLRILNLSRNYYAQLTINTFYGLKNLESLNLGESKIFYIQEGAFASMKRLKFLDLSKNPFPKRSLLSSFFDGLEQLEVLRIRGCEIATIEANSRLFSNLVALKELNLGENALTGIPAKILEPLSNLEIFDVSSNNFLSWDARMFKSNTRLHAIIASNNKIKNITEEMILDFVNLQKLDLHNNPFGCSCDDMEALSNILDRTNFHNVIVILHQYVLNCTYPEKYANVTILDYLYQIEKSHFCVLTGSNIPNTIFIALGCIAILLLLILIAFFIYRKRISYLMFLTKLFLTRRRKKAQKVGRRNHYEYDAFVSYCNEDQDFVENLVSMLENQEPHYRLCVYERDFQIGTVISESVLESLSKSRKTLLIVSEAYIKSQWCRWEVQVVENHRLFFENEFGEFSNDTLVIVKFGDICMKNVSPMLKFLMKTRIYLQWDEEPEKQNKFWDKLRKSLSKPKIIAKTI